MIRSYRHRSAASLLAAVAFAAPLAASAAAADRPAGMSEQAYRALTVRSRALNERYHLGAYAQPAAAGAARGMSPQADRALMLRSRALNERYHLGDFARAPAAPAAATTGSSVDWGTVGGAIGAALGVVVLAGVALAARGRWHPPARPSH